MKVLMLVNRLNVGGTETYVLALAKQLIKLGIQVGVGSYGGPLAPMFRASGVQVHLLPPSERRRPAKYFRTLAEKNGYSVIHGHDTPSFRWISAWGQPGKGRIFVITLHGKYVGQVPTLTAAKLAKAVVASSPQMAQWGAKRGIDAAKLVYSPNGIDTFRFKPDARTAKWKARWKAQNAFPVIVYAGRFQAPKHLIALKLIQAANRVLARYPKSVFVFTGPGPHLNTLRKAAAGIQTKYGVHRMIVQPALTDVRQLYWAADLVVGTGRVALEAMACGKPVLAVGVSGYSGPVTPQTLARSIRDHFGDHGASAPATPDRIANGLVEMLKQPKRLSEWGIFGRKTVESRFSVTGMAKQMLRLYRQKLKLPAQIQRPPSPPRAVQQQKQLVQQKQPVQQKPPIQQKPPVQPKKPILNQPPAWAKAGQKPPVPPKLPVPPKPPVQQKQPILNQPPPWAKVGQQQKR